jgi:hypothetical protein
MGLRLPCVAVLTNTPAPHAHDADYFGAVESCCCCCRCCRCCSLSHVCALPDPFALYTASDDRKRRYREAAGNHGLSKGRAVATCVGAKDHTGTPTCTRRMLTHSIFLSFWCSR